MKLKSSNLEMKTFIATYILEKENFTLEETLFFDDHPKYVKGFLDVGGKAVLVDRNLEFQDQPILASGKVKTIRSIFEIPELLKE